MEIKETRRGRKSISEVEGTVAWGEDASIRTIHEIHISSVMANVRRNSRPSGRGLYDFVLPANKSFFFEFS